MLGGPSDGCRLLVLAAVFYTVAEGRAAAPICSEDRLSLSVSLFKGATRAVLGSRLSSGAILCDPRRPHAKRAMLAASLKDVGASAASGDGSVLALGDSSRVEVYRLGASAERVWSAGLSRLSCLAVSANGKLVAAGVQAMFGDAASVPVFDAGTGKELCSLEGHSQAVHALAFTPAGALVTSDCAGVLRCWSVPAGRLLWKAKAHRGGIDAIHCSATKVISVGVDMRLCVTDLATGKVEWGDRGHPRPIMSLGVSPDGKAAATHCDRGLLVLWDLEKRKLVASRALKPQQTPALAILPDGSVFVFDGSIPRVFVLRKGELVPREDVVE